jgi:hypothetical protein
MPESKMKPETLEESRDRLQQMSEAEKRGFEAASDGQLTTRAESLADPEGPEQVLVQRAQEARITPSVSDEKDDEAVRATLEAVRAPQDDTSRAGRRGGASTRRTTRKASSEAEKPVTYGQETGE